MARNSKKPEQKTMWDNGRALISLRKTIKTVTADLSKKGKADPAREQPLAKGSRKTLRKSSAK